MIEAITANHASFRPLHPGSDFNVVLAERTQGAKDKDSRNGSGKTSIVRIVHWCLGGGADKNHPFRRSEVLATWRFSLTLRIGGSRLTASRAVETPSRIELSGDESLEELVPELRPGGDDSDWVPVGEWRGVILGRLLFGLDEKALSEKGHPSPRALLSYIARMDREAFIDPFKHFAQQGAADSQSQQAFLLGLDWQYPIRSKELRDEAGRLESAQRSVAEAAAIGHGAEDPDTLEAELQAAIVNLEGDVAKRSRELEQFHVLPQYREIEAEASALTATLHQLAGANVADQQRIGFYERATVEERPADLERLREMYAEAGVVFGRQLQRRLDDVQRFHTQLVANRREYLASEIQRLSHEVSQRADASNRADERRAQLMSVLEEHGALEEFQRLQELHATSVAQLERLRTELDQLRRFEQRLGEVQLERQQLALDTRRDLVERRDIITESVRIFGENTAALYEEAGSLLIGANRDGGYSLNYDIAKSDSQGVQEMVVFAYDLMLAELWAKSGRGPGFLIHDSTLFDGVDERQVARALELADRKSRECGFQYICLLNSDNVPRDELPADLAFDQAVVLQLSDAGDDSGLFGVRF